MLRDMHQVNIDLEDWQQEALVEMARTRGIGLETMARTLISEKLVQRIHTAFDDLLSSSAPNRFPTDIPSDSIEQRLRKLFDE